MAQYLLPKRTSLMRHVDELQGLVSQFRDGLQILLDEETRAAVRLARMREALNDDPDSVLVQCNEHIAHVGVIVRFVQNLGVVQR